MAIVRETTRLLKEYAEHKKDGGNETEGEEEFDENLQHKYVCFFYVNYLNKIAGNFQNLMDSMKKSRSFYFISQTEKFSL